MTPQEMEQRIRYLEYCILQLMFIHHVNGFPICVNVCLDDNDHPHYIEIPEVELRNVISLPQ